MSAQIYLDRFINANVIETTEIIAPDNAFDGLTHSNAKARSGSGNTRIDFDIGESITVDYCAWVNSQLNLGGWGSIVVYGTNESDFSDLNILLFLTFADWQNRSSNAFLVVPGNKGSYRYYRFVMQDKTNAPEIGISVFQGGQILELPEGIQPSYIPPPLSVKATIENNISMGGNFVGRSLTLEQYDFKIKQDNLSPAWINDNWIELLNYIQEKPFLYLWDSNRPGDIVFCWTKGDIPPPSYNNPKYLSFSFDCNGLIERD